MEFALKTAFINTFPTQAASPATCVPPSTCPFAECALGHGQGSPLVWARCPRETLQSWPRARGTGRRLFHHQALPPPPTLAEFTPGYSLGRCPRHHLPARPLRAPHPPHPARDTCGCFSCHAPRPRYQPVYLLSPAPDRCGPALPRLPQASVPQMSRKGRPWPCPSRLPGTQGRRIPFTYGVSVQQPLEVIEGADRVVTQHLVELLRNGVPLPGRHMGSSELGVRALQPWPSCPQHRHNLPWEVPTGSRGHGQMDSQAGGGFQA